MSPEILIVGAGPVGLAAALFLHEKGIKARIIEKRKEPTDQSRALGINPRTLDLLSNSGVTDAMVKNGYKGEQGNINYNKKPLFKIEFNHIQADHPFLLILSQARTETIIAAELKNRGIIVERELELTNISLSASQEITAEITNKEGQTETTHPDIVLAADGASSSIRKAFDIGFSGYTLPGDWTLIDLEIETDLNPNQAHVFMDLNDTLLMIRVEDNIWRLIGTTSDLISMIPKSCKPGKVIWESKFTINQRMVDKFNIGNIYFAGDAAHVHSPVGGRGMNIGIEDAYVFADLVSKNQLHKYNKLRRPIIQSIVKWTGRITKIIAGKSIFSKLLKRAFTLMPKSIFKQLNKRGFTWVLGLDHEVR